MIKIVKFLPEHMERLEVRPEQKNDILIKGAEVDGITLIADEPIAVFSGRMVIPGVFHASAILSLRIAERPVTFTRTVRRFLEYFSQLYALRRVQVSVRTSFPAGYKWAKALGFQCEGVMRKYAPDGEDCWLFARVFP